MGLVNAGFHFYTALPGLVWVRVSIADELCRPKREGEKVRVRVRVEGGVEWRVCYTSIEHLKGVGRCCTALYEGVDDCENPRGR